MMNPRPYAPMTLQQRIDSYADQVKVIHRRIEQEKKDRDFAFDQLMQAEAEVISKRPGWEDVKLSGVVPEGKNKYAPPAPEPPPAGPEEAPAHHEHHKKGHKHEDA